MKLHKQAELKVWKPLRNSECKECDLHKEAQCVCLLGDGPVPARGVVIGEGPGYREDDVKIPFSGRSGKFLRTALKHVGLKPQDLYFTNVVKCRPPDNRTPKKKESNKCKKLFLDEELKIVKPRAVLLLGNTALQAVLGKKGVTKLEGTVFNKDGVRYVPCRHPANIIRMGPEGKHVDEFVEALAVFQRCLLSETDEKVKIGFIKTADALQRVVKKMKGKDPVFFDVETNGLDPSRDGRKLWSMAFCQNIGEAYALLVDHPEATIKKSDIQKILAPWMSKGNFIAHNSCFDALWTYWKLKVKTHLYFCTKIGAHLMDENSNTSFKYQVMTKLKVPPWGTPDMENWDPPDVKFLVKYNAMDCHYGMRLFKEVQLPFLRKHKKIAKLAKYIIIPAMNVFLETHRRGFDLNTSKAQKTLKKTRREMAELVVKIGRLGKSKGINLKSPKQVSEMLYEKLGLEAPTYTGKGEPSTSEASLVRLKGQHKVIEPMLSYREKAKQDSTYLEPWIRRGPNLYAQYNFTGTDTGRLSSTIRKDQRGEKKLGASLHQCPRDKSIRNLVIVPDRNKYAIAACDLSQIELRQVAHEAEEPKMIEIFNNDEDIHLSTAADLLGLEDKPVEYWIKKIKKEERKKAKAVNFGFVYGMWPEKFQAYAKEKFGLDLTIEECKKYRKQFFSKFSGLDDWYDRVESFAKKHGYVESIFGRRRNLPIVLEEETEDNRWEIKAAIRQAINSPIQGAASDMNLLISALLLGELDWKYKIKGWSMGAVHDSLLFVILKKDAKAVKEMYQWTVENLPIEKYFGVKMKVPLKGDVHISECWEGQNVLVA